MDELIAPVFALCSVDSLMEEKHRLLLAAVQRQFMARHFTLRALKEMRFSRLKMPSVSDSRVVELEDCSKTQHTASLTPRSVHKVLYYP